MSELVIRINLWMDRSANGVLRENVVNPEQQAVVVNDVDRQTVRVRLYSVTCKGLHEGQSLLLC